VQFGEPQLGRRGLYPNLPLSPILKEDAQATMWLLNFADGRHDLLDIADRSKQKLMVLARAALPLAAAGLLEKVRPQ
jgi:aminopeptidase-like protein